MSTATLRSTAAACMLLLLLCVKLLTGTPCDSRIGQRARGTLAPAPDIAPLPRLRLEKAWMLA